jgi:hypothetical protein
VVRKITTRTVSASELNPDDEIVLKLSRSVSNELINLLEDPQAKKDFKEVYGKVSLSRDAGAGRGGGKLQRDALCTRGKSDKTPLSNRNLRWHPLVVSAILPEFAAPIHEIRVETLQASPTLVFVIEDDYGVLQSFPARDVHKLPKTYAATQEHWEAVSGYLKDWSLEDWSPNRCLISAMEYCSWEDAFESYASLALATIVEVYDVDYDQARSAVLSVMEGFNTAPQLKALAFPTSNFPKSRIDLTACPLCKKPFSENLSDFRYADRLVNWQPAWQSSKRREGEDNSLQVMHVKPLNELVSNHNAANVRFGHRWCNVSMSDHTVDETVNFFAFVASQHESKDLKTKGNN